MKLSAFVIAITFVVFGLLLSTRENGAPSSALALPLPGPSPQMRYTPSRAGRGHGRQSSSAMNSKKEDSVTRSRPSQTKQAEPEPASP
uniref:Pancreatic trypsin inhibitor n=1 Tax=Rhipicephalus appendiculatus TaxID=34631 RepID=A0A131YGT0_RHIAP